MGQHCAFDMAVEFAQEVRRGDKLLLSATVRIAVLAASTFRPRPLPEALYDELKALEERD